MGTSVNINHSLLHKNTHLFRINTSRFEAIDVLLTQHVNLLFPQESLGAFIFVVGVDSVDGKEELALRTFCVKGIDPDFDLREFQFSAKFVDGHRENQWK